jgi:hypothetical protein
MPPVVGQEEKDKHERESVGGKYSELIKIVPCPKDKAKYGEFNDEGYNKAITYAGVSVQEGYWVYSYPNWYVWAKRDLSKIGFEVRKKKVRLKETVLEVHFEHAQKNRVWAKRLLALFVKAIPALEERTGKVYPGVNPYVIYEDPNLRPLGLSGPTGMALRSPPAAQEWVLLHEMVHIWNAGSGPSWVREGLADYVSYQLMLRFKVPFVKGDEMPPWIEGWRKQRGTKNDLPLNDPKDHYGDVSKAKPMEFLQILYERFGNAFIDTCLRKSIREKSLTNEDLARLLRAEGVKDPSQFMNGWIVKGEYGIKRSKSSGRYTATPRRPRSASQPKKWY